MKDKIPSQAQAPIYNGDEQWLTTFKCYEEDKMIITIPDNKRALYISRDFEIHSFSFIS